MWTLPRVGKTCSLPTGIERRMFRKTTAATMPTILTPLLTRCMAGSSQEWTREGDNFQLAVTIPANTLSVGRLSAQSVDDITEQGLALTQVEGVREIRQEGETVILTVGSGDYKFRSNTG